MEDSFFHEPGAGDDFRMIQAHCIYCIRFIENRTPRSLWQETEPRQWCGYWGQLQIQMRLRSLARHSILLFLTGGLWPRGRGPWLRICSMLVCSRRNWKDCILLSLGGTFHECQSGQGEWLLFKSIWILIFLLVLSISKMGVLKSPTITVVLSIPHCGFLRFCSCILKLCYWCINI